MIRRGVVGLIQTEGRFRVCGEAADGEAAVAKAVETNPHVVVMDISMPLMNGLEATRKIKRVLPQTEVVILSVHDSEQMIREAVRAGAISYLLKTDEGPAILDAIASAARHESFFTPRATQVLVRDLRGDGKVSEGPLTARERQVLELIADGKNCHAIGELLGISFKTAAVHRNNLMHKLEMRSVSELVRYAIRNKLVEA
jgi:DNA-binding NarL/FixJ family response regulator